MRPNLISEMDIRELLEQARLFASMEGFLDVDTSRARKQIRDALTKRCREEVTRRKRVAEYHADLRARLDEAIPRS